MLNKRTNRYCEDLQDPALSALLLEAMADDPALIDAPGRADRIMRKVLASGVQPAPHGFRWIPFAWTSGTLAAATALVFLAFGLARLPQGAAPTPPAPIVAQRTASPVASMPAVTPAMTATPVPDEETPDRWQSLRQDTPVRQTAAPVTSVKTTRVAREETPVRETPADNPAQIADTLYAAGEAADAVGDHETAFANYQAAYEISPTPDSLLASGNALEQLNQEDDTSGTDTSSS